MMLRGSGRTVWIRHAARVFTSEGSRRTAVNGSRQNKPVRTATSNDASIAVAARAAMTQTRSARGRRPVVACVVRSI